MPRDNPLFLEEDLQLPVPNQTLKEPDRTIQTFTFHL